MTDAQVLKAAVAIISCDQYSDCNGCYVEHVDCENVRNETIDKIKLMLIDMGFPYEERRSR